MKKYIAYKIHIIYIKLFYLNFIKYRILLYIFTLS